MPDIVLVAAGSPVDPMNQVTGPDQDQEVVIPTAGVSAGMTAFLFGMMAGTGANGSRVSLSAATAGDWTQWTKTGNINVSGGNAVEIGVWHRRLTGSDTNPEIRHSTSANKNLGGVILVYNNVDETAPDDDVDWLASGNSENSTTPKHKDITPNSSTCAIMAVMATGAVNSGGQDLTAISQPTGFELDFSFVGESKGGGAYEPSFAVATEKDYNSTSLKDGDAVTWSNTTAGSNEQYTLGIYLVVKSGEGAASGPSTPQGLQGIVQGVNPQRSTRLGGELES